jgi:hypothetical protein
MPQYKTGTALNLLSVKADIEDSSFLSSAYFVISDFDGSFGLGKNSIIINSPPTDIKIEAYDKLKAYVQRLKEGNWNFATNRAIGTSNVYYKPGDDVYILVNGSDDFIKTVGDTIKNFAQPFVNLNFIFTTDSSKANYTIISGNPGQGLTGVVDSIGSKNVKITLGNQRQMNILHELGHALGMYHENENVSKSPLASAIRKVYKSDPEFIKSLKLSAPGQGKLSSLSPSTSVSPNVSPTPIAALINPLFSALE